MSELDNLKQDYLSVRAPNSIAAEIVSRFSHVSTSRKLNLFNYVVIPIAAAFILTWVLWIQPQDEVPTSQGLRVSLSELQTPNLVALSEMPAAPGTGLRLSDSTGLLNELRTLSITQLPQYSHKETIQ